MTGPVILIGTTPLCHVGILSDDLTVAIVWPTVHSFLCKLRIFHPFVYNNSSLCPMHMKVKMFLEYLYQK